MSVTRRATTLHRSVQGEAFRRNLRIVDSLKRLAEFEVGTRSPAHVEDAVAAADLMLDGEVLQRIDEILAAEVRVGGPAPEQMR